MIWTLDSLKTLKLMKNSLLSVVVKKTGISQEEKEFLLERR
jgi:hypothetical protein